jgi:hypothetical protein
MTDGIALGCAIMEPVSSETEKRVVDAGERYAQAAAELEAARVELVAAMITHQDDEGISNEKVARLTPLSNTQVFRLLKAGRAGRAAQPAES